MRQANRVSVVPSQIVPSVQEAVLGYEQATGGSLAAPGTFGRDLLATYPDKEAERQVEMNQRFDPREVFSCTVNGDTVLLQEAVLFHHRISHLLHETA